MNNEQHNQTPPPEHNDLAQLWQGIETESQLSAQELSKLAKRSKLKNKLLFAWDWLGCGLIGVALYISMARQLSYLIVAWLVLALLFSIWLTLQFNKFRVSGERALSGTTANYNHYLIEKAKADIKLGKLLNISNWIFAISLVLVFVTEPLLPVKPMFSDPEKRLYLIAWAIFWTGVWFYYGYRKIRKGKQILKQLQ